MKFLKKKPFDIKQIGNMKIFEINVNRHINHYNFENGKLIVNDFLNNVRNKFRVSSQVIIKSSVSIENIQPFLIETSASVINLQDWPMNPYQTAFFNKHIFFSLKNDILRN